MNCLFGWVVANHEVLLVLYVQVNYLKEFGLEIEDVGKLLAYKPQLMNCSIEDKWKPLVKYFYYLGISKDGLRRMLTIKPVVFCLDLETIIVPKVILSCLMVNLLQTFLSIFYNKNRTPMHELGNADYLARNSHSE